MVLACIAGDCIYCRCMGVRLMCIRPSTVVGFVVVSTVLYVIIIVVIVVVVVVVVVAMLLSLLFAAFQMLSCLRSGVIKS